MCPSKDSCISRIFLLKFWAKYRRCGSHTRPLLSEGVQWLERATNWTQNLQWIKIKHIETCRWSLLSVEVVAPKGAVSLGLKVLNQNQPVVLRTRPVVLSSVSFAVCLSSFKTLTCKVSPFLRTTAYNVVCDWSLQHWFRHYVQENTTLFRRTHEANGRPFHCPELLSWRPCP